MTTITPTTDKLAYSIRDLEALLSTTRWTLRPLIANGTLPARYAGKSKPVFLVNDVREYMGLPRIQFDTNAVYSRQEFSRAVSLSDELIRQAERRGDLITFKHGSRTRVSVEEAMRWLESLPTEKPSA